MTHDRRIHRIAETLWRELDYELPTDPYTLAQRIVTDLDNDPEAAVPTDRYTCTECGSTYPVPSLARDCELRHLEDREESA